MELVKQLCKLTSCFTLLHVLFSRDIINEVLYFILMDKMEFVRNVFLVGKKNKSGAARWLTSFTMMLSILLSVYLLKPMKEFPKNMDMVLQHQQENATFNRASCKIDTIGNLDLPNSILSDDQTFMRYAECLAMKMNKRHESFFIHQTMGVMYKKDTHFKPNLVLYIELHTTANVTRAHMESIMKKEIQSANLSKCSKIFQVNHLKCNFYS